MRRKLGGAFLVVLGAVLALPGFAQADRYLYVSGFSSSSVAGFALTMTGFSITTGGLRPISGGGYPAATNASPTVMTPDGRYLYVAGQSASLEWII